MGEKVFCIEILGEGAFHRFLVQSGWSGKDYLFHYNTATNSHVRAYARFEDYLAERVDMHKSANIWPLMANLAEADQIDPACYVASQEPNRASAREPETPEQVEPVGSEQPEQPDEGEGEAAAEDEATGDGDPVAETPRRRGRPPKNAS